MRASPKGTFSTDSGTGGVHFIRRTLGERRVALLSFSSGDSLGHALSFNPRTITDFGGYWRRGGVQNILEGRGATSCVEYSDLLAVSRLSLQTGI